MRNKQHFPATVLGPLPLFGRTLGLFVFSCCIVDGNKVSFVPGAFARLLTLVCMVQPIVEKPRRFEVSFFVSMVDARKTVAFPSALPYKSHVGKTFFYSIYLLYGGSTILSWICSLSPT